MGVRWLVVVFAFAFFVQASLSLPVEQELGEIPLNEPEGKFFYYIFKVEPRFVPAPTLTMFFFQICLFVIV